MEDARIKDLENQVVELRLLVAQLVAAAPAAAPAPAPHHPSETVVESTATDTAVASRRGMLKLAGAAAVGAVAVAVTGNAQPAAAADGGTFTLGQSNLAASTTQLTGRLGVIADSGTTWVLDPVPAQSSPGYGGTIYGFNTNSTADANIRAGVIGVSSPFIFTGNNQTAHGVVGLASSDTNNGSGVYGISTSLKVGSPGVMAKANAGATIQMIPTATGAPTTGAWTVGALRPDTAGNLWYCTASGTPGAWKNLSAPFPASPVVSQYFPISPVRVYDSRVPLPTPGVISTGGTRTISVASGRDLTTGNINAADVVPAGATAIACNVTVDRTQTGGYLTVNPGGNSTVTSSTINWFGNGQTLANGVTVTISASREVTVIAGGPGATDFVLDVTGYFR